MRLVSWLIAACLLVFSGCSKENNIDASGNVLGVGQQCSGPGDKGCGEGSACVLGYCRHGCTNDAECPQGAICVGDIPPYGCTMPEEGACGANEDCPQGLLCAVDHICRHACEVRENCPRNEHRCVAGACVGTGESDVAKWQCDIESYGDCDPRILYGYPDVGITTACNIVDAGCIEVDNCGVRAFAEVLTSVTDEEKVAMGNAFYETPLFACPGSCPTGRYFCSRAVLQNCADDPACAPCLVGESFKPPFACRPSAIRVSEMCECLDRPNPCPPPSPTCPSCTQDPPYVLSRPISNCTVALPDAFGGGYYWSVSQDIVEVFSRDGVVAESEYTLTDATLTFSDGACNAPDLTILMCQDPAGCVSGLTDMTACKDVVVE